MKEKRHSPKNQTLTRALCRPKQGKDNFSAAFYYCPGRRYRLPVKHTPENTKEIELHSSKSEPPIKSNGQERTSTFTSEILLWNDKNLFFSATLPVSSVKQHDPYQFVKEEEFVTDQEFGDIEMVTFTKGSV